MPPGSLLAAQAPHAPCARLGTPCARSWALALLVVLIALVPLAHASPPDPVWIAGVYDDADFDEVVFAVDTSTGLVEHALLLVGNSVLIPGGAIRPDALARPASVSLAAVRGRSPPS